MQEYIPIETMNGAYVKLNRLFGFSSWARIFICIGARGYGKTFASKRKCLKDFIFRKLKFVILRDTTAACDEICASGGLKLFSDVFRLDVFKKHTYNIERYQIYIDGKNAGEVMPLSTYYKYKGNAYTNVGWVLFDEFIQEDVQAYRGNRARQFANSIETIIRDNPITRVMMTANALELGNDILELLGIHIVNGKYGYYLNKQKKVAVLYAPNSPEFEERKRTSISATITAGTFLDDSMNKNKFEGTGCIIFEKRLPCTLWGIYYNNEGECFRLYQAKSGDEYYACKDINPKSYNYMRYVFNAKQATNDRILIDTKSRTWLKSLLQNQQIQFESQYIFNIFCSVVNNTLKK